MAEFVSKRLKEALRPLAIGAALTLTLMAVNNCVTVPCAPPVIGGGYVGYGNAAPPMIMAPMPGQYIPPSVSYSPYGGFYSGYGYGYVSPPIIFNTGPIMPPVIHRQDRWIRQRR